MSDLNAIKARMHSISPTAMSKLPKAVQTLLKEDLPRLLDVADAGVSFRAAKLGSMSGIVRLAKFKELIDDLAPPSPEQQIKDMPW